MLAASSGLLRAADSAKDLQERQRAKVAAAEQARAAQAASRKAAADASFRAAQAKAREKANFDRMVQQNSQRADQDLAEAIRFEGEISRRQERELNEMHRQWLDQQQQEEAAAEAELQRERQLLMQQHAQEAARKAAEEEARQRKLRLERDKKALASFQALQARLASGEPMEQPQGAGHAFNAQGPLLPPVSVPIDNPFVLAPAPAAAPPAADVARSAPAANPWADAASSATGARPASAGNTARGTAQR